MTRALVELLRSSKGKASSYELARKFIGVDKRPGDVARHSKRLLRERSRKSI
jgi:hypothetical protein